MRQREQKQKGKILSGSVVQTNMQKTIIVEVTQITRHPLYRKTMRRTKRVLAHNVGDAVKVGDVVSIVETRPISRRKHFIVLEKKG